MERIVSPGVFTQENDKSFITQGIQDISAAFIGTTPFGRALIPTKVTSYSDFEVQFGKSNGEHYIPLGVKEYLKNAASATIVRLLNLGGYTHSNVAAIVLSSSYGGEKVVGVLHHTSNAVGSDLNATQTGSDSDPTDFDLTLSGSLISSTAYTALSLKSTDPNYIGKIFSSTPINSTINAYNYVLFGNYTDASISSSASGTVSIVTASDLTLTNDYSNAITPYVQSQEVAGTVYDLFKAETIADGDSANTTIKIGITNIKYASEIPNNDYGSFSLVVRDIDDNDRAPLVLETYNNLNLNPDSVDYIAKRVGDKKPSYDTTEKKITWAGDYDIKSDYITITVHDDVKNKSYSGDLVPHGFASIQQSLDIAGYNMPTASMVIKQQYNDLWNDKIYFGFDFDFDDTDNYNYLKPVDTDAGTGSNQPFNLSTDAEWEDNSEPTSQSIAARKFAVPFQEGFDGKNPATPRYLGDNSNFGASNSMGFNITNSASSGSVIYSRALDILSDPEKYDINLITTPGIIREYSSYIITKAIDTVEERNDCFYIFDSVAYDQKDIDEPIDEISTLDTSYAATYYPWVKIQDTMGTGKNIWVPPSVVMPGVFAYNDKVGYEWFAPAGLNRGLTFASDVYVQLKRADRDTLYESRVNPIVSFPNEGIVVWGQKTLQSKASALDRINVRRLLINIKKFIASSVRYLVFEANDTKTRNRFLNMVNPYLETIQQRSGIYVFKVVCDETNNTPDVIDRNVMAAELWIQPSRTAEFIVVNLNIMATGTSFSN